MGPAGLHVQAGEETLWAVVIGAVLATVGGFAATQLESVLRRRERERGAALLFGELLSVLDLIITLASEARGRGDPFGPLTMRLLRAARRETDTYDRNRESLYELRDGAVRARIHTMMVRMTLTLDGVFDSTAEITVAQAALDALGPADPVRADAEQRLARLSEARDASFDFGVETAGQIKPILVALRPLAKDRFDAHESVARGP